MKSVVWKSNVLLLLTAIIWGFAFVAQRVGMNYVEPFMFNGVRFALGSASLLPLLWFDRRRRGNDAGAARVDAQSALWGGALAGAVLFMGSTLQQAGVVYTTAGKAGFITGLYVVIVPLMGLLWGQHSHGRIWLGALLAVVGLYLLSVSGQFTFSPGALLVLIGAFFWAGHVQVIAWLTRKIDPLVLSFFQCMVCSALSLIAAAFTESISVAGIVQAAVPILYGGVMSVGVAYTLQVVGQKGAHPAHAAIILSLEAVFALIGGWLLLDETLSARGGIGCTLMLIGMLVSQLELRPGVPVSSQGKV
ncbi:MAG: DMT family transporter [Anaerolineae bacterium]|nr:DMT family transporter [Anaerolineae bacterium]